MTRDQPHVVPLLPLLPVEEEDVVEALDHADALGELRGDAWADYMLRRLAGCKRAIAHCERVAREERERWERWAEGRAAPYREAIQQIEDALRTYAEQERAAGRWGRRKSRELPHGRLSFRAVGPAYKRVDEDALVTWAQNAGDPLRLLRMRVEPDWPAVKKRLRVVEDGDALLAVDVDTGEVVPGVVVERAEGESFRVTVGGDE